jgi:hypothetical protein
MEIIVEKGVGLEVDKMTGGTFLLCGGLTGLGFWIC